MSQNINPPNGPSNSPKSPISLKSVGMGDQVSAMLQPATVNNAKMRQQDLPRPLPEGMLTSNEPLYDCVAYIIYCPQHQNIAITNVAKCKSIWLPFVELPDRGVTWSMASHEGVSMLIGRNDTEMDGEEAERTAPKYTLSFLNVLRITLPSKKVVMRLTQFVRLEDNPNFSCCRNTDRVNWLPLDDIHQPMSQLKNLWGPELFQMTELLLKSPTQDLQIVQELGPSHALHYLNKNDSWQQELLKTFKLTEKHIFDLYTNFLSHCYPSLCMCLESFRIYFLKCGVDFAETELVRLFDAFCQSEERRSYVDFHDFLLTLLAMEPNCPSKLEARSRLIFRYYDSDKSGQLSLTNICSLLKDANVVWQDPMKAEEEARLLLKKRQSLSYLEFVRTFKQKILRDLCRSNQSMLKQISYSIADQRKERARLIKACEGKLKAVRTTKGTCWMCRAQQYEYGNHMVTIDTAGRCVEPTMIPVKSSSSSSSKSQSKDVIMTRSRFSVEYVFATGSMPNIFLDLIRDFHHKKDAQSVGLMSQPHEWPILHKYVRFMCKELSTMLARESKLLKLNAPAIVVGNMCGSLQDLMALEKQFWQSFPVIPESLIFLGNYSGQYCSNGIECLIYLFALKLCSPNKVVLLRGVTELDATSGSALRGQCHKRYGAERGQIIFAIFQQVFSRLPIVALLDDLICCTPSGIPTGERQMSSLLKLPKEMPTVHRDSLMAYEIITRLPKDDSPIDQAVDSGHPGHCSNRVNKNPAGKAGIFDPTAKSAYKGTNKSKSNKKASAIKSVPETKSIKSIKSAKSVQANPPLSTVDTSNLIKSQQLTLPTSMPEQLKMKNEASDNRNFAQADSYKFEVGSKLSKSKATFLVKYARKFGKDATKCKNTNEHSPGGPPKSSNRPKTADKRPKSPNQEESTPFLEPEFAQFMAVNGFAYMIRSGSLCRLGLALKYKRCISIFSCSSFAQSNNQASVALVDGYSVRMVRHSNSRRNDAMTPNVTNNTNTN